MVILHKSFFINYALKNVKKLMAMFHLLKIRTSIEIFKNEKCKVTFGLEYIIFRYCVEDIETQTCDLGSICCLFCLNWY